MTRKKVNMNTMTRRIMEKKIRKMMRRIMKVIMMRKLKMENKKSRKIKIQRKWMITMTMKITIMRRRGKMRMS